MNISVELHTLDELHVKGLIGGEIDAFTAPILREKLMEITLQENTHVELNLMDVSYMDSTGLGVFVGFYKSINAANGHMELTGLSSRLKRLFDITGLVEIMDIQATDKEVKIDEPFDYVEIRVPAKPQYVSVARLTISGLANRIGFTYDDIEDLKIAASEAITNAVQHAYADNEEGEVVIGCALYEEKMEIMVADHGKSFNFEETKAKVGPYHELEEISFLREGGLGLYLIETLMDEVKVHHQEGVTVFMTKHVGVEQVDENVEHVPS